MEHWSTCVQYLDESMYTNILLLQGYLHL